MRPISTLRDQTAVSSIHGYMSNGDYHIAESTGMVSGNITPSTEV